MRKIVITGVSAAILIILASCTTMEAVPKENSIHRFIDLFNTGNAALIGEMTSIPMLIDGEVVARSDDADFFWNRLEEVGFKLDKETEYNVQAVSKKARLLFGDTWEVNTFFDKYVPNTAVIVRVSGPGGDFILLLSGRKGKYPFIFGFTGPLL